MRNITLQTTQHLEMSAMGELANKAFGKSILKCKKVDIER